VGELRGSDIATVHDQLGRPPTTSFTVAARCSGGHPLVIRNAPFDADGRPFPTLFWLTCPDAVRAVSRVEAGGEIARLNERIEAEPAFAEAVERAHREYALERARADPQAESHGGVGGTRAGIKCLHAHYANHLAGGADPVGAEVAEVVEPIHAPPAGRVAAVDQGTNSIRLLVAEPVPSGGFDELARDMVITRLGQGIDASGQIAPEALERTTAVLHRFVRRARALHAGRIRVGATAAVREATNREVFARRVRELAGSDLEVLSGDREAELSFLGATRDLDEPGPFLVLDIGGGSTELVLGSDRPDAAVSTRMGSVRLTERCVRHDPPTEDDLEAIRREVDAILQEAERAVPVERARTLVAVAGTSTTVQAIALGLEAYDPERIHRTRLGLPEAERVLRGLAESTSEERSAMPVMAPGRGDVIVAGAVILVEVMRRFGFETAVVSESDILDGLVLEMLASP
jgi:exopolyphosphatase/guanosine-5'-triphosphate,3'-diphosphate pyrophosphatase